MAEGEDLVDAALERGVRPVALLVDADRVPDDDPRIAATEGLAERYRVPGNLLARASSLAAPPRVIGVFPQPAARSFRDVRFPPALGVYLAGVADPGNVGTLVRTAAALGADWLALGPGSADAFHPRAVRAAMGATFAVPLLEGVSPADLGTRGGFDVVGAVPRGGVPPWEADLTRPMVLALRRRAVRAGRGARRARRRAGGGARDDPPGARLGVAERRRRGRRPARRGRPPARARGGGRRGPVG